MSLRSRRFLVRLFVAAFLLGGAFPALGQPTGGTVSVDFRVTYDAATGQIGVDEDTELTLLSASGTRNALLHVTVWRKDRTPVLNFHTGLPAAGTLSFRVSSLLKGTFNVNPLVQNPDINLCASSSWALVTLAELSSYHSPSSSLQAATLLKEAIDQSPDLYPGDGVYTGPFEGFLTVDVVNACSLLFPSESGYYQDEVLATTPSPLTPNLLRATSRRIYTVQGQVTTRETDAMVYPFDANLTLTSGKKTFYSNLILPKTITDTNASLSPAGFYGDGRALLVIRNGSFDVYPSFDFWRATSWPAGTAITAPSSGRYSTHGALFTGLGTIQTLEQELDLPAGSTRIDLTYYLKITTEEPIPSGVPYDNLSVDVLDAATGAVLVHVRTFTQDDASLGFLKRTFAGPLAGGRRVKLRFYATQDYVYKTSFILDDVSLRVE